MFMDVARKSPDEIAGKVISFATAAETPPKAN
jgi:hypothetical protein